MPDQQDSSVVKKFMRKATKPQHIKPEHVFPAGTLETPGQGLVLPKVFFPPEPSIKLVHSAP